MKRLLFHTLTVLAAVLAPVAKAAAPAKPNVIFILADDMGWADLRCQGHPYAQTPNLDRLASEGTRFTQCYATGVTCCPSRTGFMTGKFPATFAKYPAGSGFGDRVTVTELLKKHGYATGHFGKWHIGPEAKAGVYGMDAVGAEEEEGGRKRAAAQSERGRDAHIYDAAIRFIEEHRGGPFYVNIWDHIPHHPIDPSPAVVAAFGPLQVDESKFPASMRENFELCRQRGGDVSEHLRNFLAEIRALDAEVGRLLKRLDELGLRENTIVAFSSDQGPAHIRDTADDADGSDKKERKRAEKGRTNNNERAAEREALRLNAMGFAGPFRGGKHTQYEGGVRIPWIVRWPGQVPAGRVDEQSVLSGADWLPTLCALTGVKIDAANFDGEDASAAWLGQAAHTRTKPLLWRTSAPRPPITIREGNWKLHVPGGRKGELELFDVATDPGEEHNLVAQKPELVKQLTAKIEAWQATLPKEYDKAGEKDDGK